MFKKSDNDILQQDLKNKENNIKLQQNASFVGSSNDPFSTPARDNYQTYPYDYFSSSDCKVFFGDIWVDDIVSIQYNSSQSKTPIYGYASQNFDAIAKGQVLVQGSLAIAFKETGYLNIIQATLEAQKRNASQVIQTKLNSYKTEAERGNAKYIQGLNSEGQVSVQYSPNGSPQIIRQQQTIEQILTNKKGNVASSGVTNNLGLGAKDNRDFEDFAEILEDSIWGDSNGESINITNKLKRVDEFDYNSNGGITTAKGRQYSDVLNIMLTFGDINDYRAEHTIVVLNDVHFTSSSMIVGTDGSPIFEEYAFIARDINDSITGKSINVSPIKLNVGIDNLKLSTLDNINEVEKFLNEKDSTSQVTFNFLSAFNGVKSDNPSINGWNRYSGQIIATFVSNKSEPFTDQVCKFAERIINETYYPEVVSTSNSQYIVELDMTGFTDNKITMILDQVTEGTRTYRVISPTRSGFSSVNLITRDDLFSGSELPKPTQDVPISSTPNQKKQASINESTKVKEAQVLASFEPGVNGPQTEVERLTTIEKTVKQEKNKQTIDNTTQLGTAITGTTFTHYTRPDEHPGSVGNDSIVTADIGNLVRDEQNKIVSAGYAPAAIGGEVYGVSDSAFSVKTKSGIVTYAHIDPSYTKTLKKGDQLQTGDRVDFINDHYHIQSQKKYYAPTVFENTIKKNLDIGYRNTSPTQYEFKYK